MGLIPLEDALIPDNHTNGIEKVPKEDSSDGGFSLFDIANLAADQKATSTGMKEEIILLSWLMVLLRSREDSQISYDWSYTDGTGDSENGDVNELSMNEVMEGLDDHVGTVASTIYQNLPMGVSSPASMILSTSSMLKTSDTTKDEVII